MAKIGMNQDLGLRHELRLEPRMLQSIEALQLPAQELEGWLLRAAEENEALVVGEARPEPERVPGEGRRLDREASERHDQMLRNQPARAKGVVERLEEQLTLLDLPPGRESWVRLCVSALDRAGYLPSDDAALLELASAEGLAGGPEELAGALAVLRRLEPRGLGARNAVEALLLQIDEDDPDHGLLRALLEDYLDDLARNKLPRVARALGVDLASLQALVARLAQLDPRPAAELIDEAAPTIRPDCTVERGEHGTVVSIDHSALPDVRVDDDLGELARDRTQSADVRSYLRDKLDRARWVVDAVQQRRHTLQRVCAAVFERQRAFLEHGSGHLAPLRMGEVADALGLHVSTVSRAVAGKYAHTPWGIYPLRHFFQASAGADEASARCDVREAVRDVVAAEDPTRPLSDDEIAAAMERRGWHLARRTIAKYRDELGIASSYRRRRY